MDVDVYLFGVILLAYLIKGITGFGNTLVINALLSFVKETKFISPVDLILGLPANIYMAWRERRMIEWKTVIPLSTAVTIGSIPGMLLLNIGGDKLLKSILGMLLIVLSIEIFTREKKLPVWEHVNSGKLLVFIIGIVSGIFMGLFGIGALLAAHINRQTDSRNQYRANLCFVFIIDNVIRFAGYYYNGIINSELMLVSFYLAPAVVAGMILGNRLDSRMGEEWVRKLIMLLLFISGFVCIFTYKFGL